MENQKTSGGGGGGGGDGEIELPEEIIQQIQNFLNRKEASRTSILSKSWYRAWISRPYLDFNEDDFPHHSDEFSVFAKKTMQRYEDSNLTVKSLTLTTTPSEAKPDHPHDSLATDLIVRAMKLGAIDLHTSLWNRLFLLPREVFESKTLVVLRASGCAFDLSEVTTRSHLQVLDFFRLNLKGRSTILNGRQLVSYDLSSKFPYLKELTIRNCIGYNGLRINSPSLERIRFDDSKILTAELDVPNIRKFHLEGPASSSFTFAATRGEWEADVHVTCSGTDNLWFMRLNNLLTNLRGAKVSVCIRVECGWEKRYCDYSSNVVEALAVPEVEKVELLDPAMVTRALAPNFLDGLFFSCRPKWIVASWFPHNVWTDQNYLVKFVCRVLVEELECRACCIPNVNMIGEHELDQFNVELFEESVGEWQSVPYWKTLLEYPVKKHKVRFQLKWGND